MRQGDILVARITTPAWTPLFALAAGVVTDVGGPLSHSSIVAREYHIPAVLGTGVATERLSSGQRVTVDRSEEHTSELQSRLHLVCRLLLEKKNEAGRLLAPRHHLLHDA